MPHPATAASHAYFPSRGLAPPSFPPPRPQPCSPSVAARPAQPPRLARAAKLGARVGAEEAERGQRREAAAAAAPPSGALEMFSRRGHADVKKSAQKALDPRKEPLTRLKHLRALMGEWRGASARQQHQELRAREGGGGGLKDRSGVGGGRLRCERVSPASCTSWQLPWSSLLIVL